MMFLFVVLLSMRLSCSKWRQAGTMATPSTSCLSCVVQRHGLCEMCSEHACLCMHVNYIVIPGNHGNILRVASDFCCLLGRQQAV